MIENTNVNEKIKDKELSLNYNNPIFPNKNTIIFYQAK